MTAVEKAPVLTVPRPQQVAYVDVAWAWTDDESAEEYARLYRIGDDTVVFTEDIHSHVGDPYGYVTLEMKLSELRALVASLGRRKAAQPPDDIDEDIVIGWLEERGVEVPGASGFLVRVGDDNVMARGRCGDYVGTLSLRRLRAVVKAAAKLPILEDSQ